MDLQSIWIRSYNLFVDSVREEFRPKQSRPSKPPIDPSQSDRASANEVKGDTKSFVQFLKANTSAGKPTIIDQPHKKHVVIPLVECIDAKRASFITGKVFDP
jgi:hypothetical protein